MSNQHREKMIVFNWCQTGPYKKKFLLPESFLALNLTISSPILRRRRPRARSKTRAGAGPPARTRPQARARSRDELPSREESLCSQVGAAERTRQATMEVIETFSFFFPGSSCLTLLPTVVTMTVVVLGWLLMAFNWKLENLIHNSASYTRHFYSTDSINNFLFG